MGRSELGRRLKEARLARKMTQSEVVGEFITRNMLSQIESGNAMPSIKTLEYLSKKLEIPIEQLMADEKRPETTLEILLQAKEAVRKKHYEEAITLLTQTETERLELIKDEASALLARCYLQMALIQKKSLERLQAEISRKGCSKNSIALPEKEALETEEGDETEGFLLHQKIHQTEKKLVEYAREAGYYAGEGIYASKEIRMEALVLEHGRELEGRR